MPAEVLLAPETYAVLQRVPSAWWPEVDATREIATALGLANSAVARRLAHLVAIGLVERRKRPTIAPVREVRRVGRD